MNFGNPIDVTMMEQIAGVLGGLTVIAYILKLRRRRYEIPFSKLWQRVLREKESSSLWRRLKRFLSLLVQLAFLALLFGAVSDPRIGQASPAGRNVVLIVDASASMKAQDGGSSRLPRVELAKLKAKEILRGMGGADVAMVVRMDGQTTALTRFDSDVPRLLKTIDTIEASDTAADLPRALQAAADALHNRKNPLIVIVGDGAYREEAKQQVVWEDPHVEATKDPKSTDATKTDQAAASLGKSTSGQGPIKLGYADLRGIEVTFVPIGKTDEQIAAIKKQKATVDELEAKAKAAPDDKAIADKLSVERFDLAKLSGSRNVGIVAFNVRRYFQNKLSYEVLVEIQNFGVETENVQFTLFAGNDAVDVKTLEIKGGDKIRKIYPDLGGGEDRELRGKITMLPRTDPDTNAVISGPDDFALDDQAFALLPERRKQKILLVSHDNLYLEGALLTDANMQVDKVTPEEYPTELANGEVRKYDVVVYDGYTPDEAPPVPAAMYFGPSGDKSPVPIRGDVKRPFITDVEQNHPVTRWVTLADVNIDHSAVFSPQNGDTVLASSIRDPLVVAGKRTGRKFIAYGFGLDGTDLMLRVAFPVLIVNTLDWFAGDDAELITTYRTGHAWSIPVDADENVREASFWDPTATGAAKAPIIDGRATYYGRHVGVYKVTSGDNQLYVAANLADPLESNVSPQTELVLGGKKLAEPPAFKPTVSRQVWIWLVLAALVLSSIEWLTYNRRITV